MGGPHRISMICVVARDHDFDEAALLDRCRDQLSSQKLQAAGHIVETIPRCRQDKIMRYLFRTTG